MCLCSECLRNANTAVQITLPVPQTISVPLSQPPAERTYTATELDQILKDASRYFAGDHLNAGVVLGEVRRRLALTSALRQEDERG